MSPFSRKKKHSEAPSTLAASGLTSSQVALSQQPLVPTNSRSQSQSIQEKQQSQPIGPWSAHAPSTFGKSQSPFPRCVYALSTDATAAGELFLFGGYAESSKSATNDLYMISTQNFSTTLLQTSGDIPSPRYGHHAVLTSTIFLIWGGMTDFSKRPHECNDDSLYFLHLVSREWTRIVANGPGPGFRHNHTMTLVGSKLIVFDGRISDKRLNDIWGLDLNSLKSNPFWESYEPAPGNVKPPPRASHISVTTGDRIIIFGGGNSTGSLNDTWSFNILTRKWIELKCTGSIPAPRAAHAGVLIGNVMYVYGGGPAGGGDCFGDLTALNLSTQQWTIFQDIRPSPWGRFRHAMAHDGTRVFVLGGTLSSGTHTDEAKLIRVLDTKLLVHPKPDSNAVEHSEKTTQVTQPAQKLSMGHATQVQLHQSSSSSLDTHAAHYTSPFQKAAAEGMGRRTSPPVTREQNPSLNGLPSGPTGASGRPRRVPEEDDDGKCSTGHAKLVTPNAPSEKEIAKLDGRLIELERQLSETLVVQTERDRRIEQLTDKLAEAVEENKRTGQELRELQTKLDDSLMSHDHALEQAKSNAAEEKKHVGLELREMRAELKTSKSESAALRMRLADMENGDSKGNAKADSYRTPTATGLVNTEEDRVMHKLMERMQVMEAEMASLRLNEKSEKCFETMECRNED